MINNRQPVPSMMDLRPVLPAWITPTLQWALLLGLAVLLAFPIIVASEVPLIDYPNHWARQYIIYSGDAGPLAEFYEYRWQFIVAIGADVFVQALAAIVDLDTAMRTFAVAALLLPYLGAVYLGRVLHGSWTGPALWSALFAFNAPFQYGFMNLTFGYGVALLLYAAWIRWRNAESMFRTAAFTIAACALMFTHLHAFGVYCLAVAGWEISRRVWFWISCGVPTIVAEARATLIEATRVSVHVAVPVLLFFLLSPSAERISQVTFGDWQSKLRALVTPISFVSPYVELPIGAAAGAIFALGLWKGLIIFRADQALTIGILLIAFLALPSCLLGNCFVDYRLVTAIAFFGVAAFNFSARCTPKVQSMLHAAMVALIVLRVGDLHREWNAIQPTLAAMRAALEEMPVGSKLFIARGEVPAGFAERAPGIWQWPAASVIWRQAFVPTLFAGKSHQALAIRPPYPEYPSPPARVASAAIAGFDYLIIIYPRTVLIDSAVSCEWRAINPAFSFCRLSQKR